MLKEHLVAGHLFYDSDVAWGGLYYVASMAGQPPLVLIELAGHSQEDLIARGHPRSKTSVVEAPRIAAPLIASALMKPNSHVALLPIPATAMQLRFCP